MNENPGCIGWLLQLLGFQAASKPETPYEKRSSFLSPAEVSLYHVMRSTLKDKAAICCKVRVADLLTVAPGNDRSHFSRISQKHVDFVLCDPATMKPMAAVELDDRSHQRADRIKRDEFLNAAFDAAGMPLVRISARAGYTPSEILNTLTPHLS